MKYTGDTQDGKRIYSMNEEIRRHVRFEWIDLLDAEQAPRLMAHPADIAVLKNTFYIYSSAWWEEPMKSGIGRIITSVKPGGLFVTDNHLSGALFNEESRRRIGILTPPEHLYFTWPGLTEVPHIPGHPDIENNLPTSYDDPRLKAETWGSRYKWALDNYRDEVISHHGCNPTGVYVKQ